MDIGIFIKSNVISQQLYLLNYTITQYVLVQKGQEKM